MAAELDRDELVRLAERAARGDAPSMDALVRHHYEQMLVVARRGSKGFGDGEEYLGVCAEFFMRRVQSWRAGMGASVWTYASRGMLGEVRRVCHRSTGAIDVPRTATTAKEQTKQKAMLAKQCYSTDRRHGYAGYDGQGDGLDSDRQALMCEPHVNGEARHLADNIDWVRTKARALDRHERIAVMMTLDGHTQREIGKAIGLSDSMVSRLLSTGMAYLKEQAQGLTV